MEKKKTKELRIFFIIPDGCSSENDCNDCMKMAFQECVEAELSPQWLPSGEALSLPQAKNTVVILQEFKGQLFESLRPTKIVILGPMCVRSCLTEHLPIPENKTPVFTTAMRGLTITASQVSTEIKAKIKEKVGFMGGVYTNNLNGSVTHLVTDSVRSAKYESAGQSGIPAMLVSWVDTVWEESLKRNIRATDPALIKQHRCPIFHNMHITCSHLSKTEKDEIKELVTQNGGIFTAQLRQRETNLLVINDPQGDKYKHARNWGLACVRPEYILESIRRGYAVGSTEFMVQPSVKCSTPTKDDNLPNFTLNSQASISIIAMETSKSSIDETQMTMANITQMSSQQRIPPRTPGSQHAQVVNTITVPDAKKAGSFVDGCKVFLSGFRVVEAEKLKKILSLGGATVFSELSDSVSHVLVGDFVIQDVKTLTSLAQKPHVVSVDWLAECIKQRSRVSEESFYCLQMGRVAPEPPSPLSQKGMQLLQPTNQDESQVQMPPPTEPPVSRKLFSEFLRDNAKSPGKQASANDSYSTMSSRESSVQADYFVGQKFVIAGFSTEVTEDIEAAIESAGGCVVAANFTGVADYAVVPTKPTIPNITAVEVVTDLWLGDCMDQGAVVQTQYYHQPLSATDKRPLVAVCLSLSNYFGKEKAFLTQLSELLGAKYQDIFARVAKKETKPSTHLVCPKPEGAKYKAAVKWRLPAVDKEWLLACARTGVQVDITPYLITENNIDKSSSSESRGRSLVPETPTLPARPIPVAVGVPTPEPKVTGMSATPAPPHPVVSSLKRKSSMVTPEGFNQSVASTPDTPYGQVFQTPTAESKKRWKKYIDSFPSQTVSPPPAKVSKRKSTPLSEIKRKIWAVALESSDADANLNYSIEDMEEDHENENKNENRVTPLRDEEGIAKATPSRSTTKHSESHSSSKNNDNVEVRRTSINSSRSTPTIEDFKSSSHTQEIPARSKDMFRGQSPMPRETPQQPKKSPGNEKVYAMLNQLHKRLSTGIGGEDPLTLPQRELTSQVPPDNNSQKQVVTTVLPESQPFLVGWEDPIESAERAKIESGNSTPTSTSKPAVKPRRFVLSNVAEKEKYEKLLQSLGETVITDSVYNSATTHLIMDEPIRSEKLLCCLAAGQWVLHTSYIDNMVAQNKYLPNEAKYEWGSGEELPHLAPGTIVQQMANAAARWRQQMNSDGQGAFTGMRAVLVTGESRFESYKRLIIAGGGQVVPHSSVSEATHCFVENKMALMPGLLSQCVTHNVPCLPPVFLGDLLIKFPPPCVQDNLIPDYEKLLIQSKSLV